MSITPEMFTSIKQDYETPLDVFDYLNNIYNFECDLFASDKNALCDNYFTEDNSAFDNVWYKTNFANPPYKTKLQDEAFKLAYLNSIHRDNTTVMLVPARTDTIRFHKWVFPHKNVDIIFLEGRLKFGDSEQGAPFPSCIIIFNGGSHASNWEIQTN